MKLEISNRLDVPTPDSNYGNYILEMSKRIDAVPADIVGLWYAPGYPELTTSQMLQVASSPQNHIVMNI